MKLKLEREHYRASSRGISTWCDCVAVSVVFSITHIDLPCDVCVVIVVETNWQQEAAYGS